MKTLFFYSPCLLSKKWGFSIGELFAAVFSKIVRPESCRENQARDTVQFLGLKADAFFGTKFPEKVSFEHAGAVDHGR